MSDKIFIVGCGDIGSRVGKLERTAGYKILAMARSNSTALKLSADGFEVLKGDLDAATPCASLPEHPAILYYFAPPSPIGFEDRRLARFLDGLTRANAPQRCVYISTSGVYGDCGGAWVSEAHPANPKSDRARRRLDAELRFRAWCEPHGVDLVILRVPGIYGPGRMPIDRIRQRIPVLREEESPFTNRIHADDLAAICIAAAHAARAEGIYNVSDGHPTTMTDYFFRIADLLGLSRPPTISMQEARRILSPGMLSFLDESKRLDNRRMLSDLAIRLHYPDLASGLPACLAAS